MSTYRLLRLMLYAYPIIWFFLGIGAFLLFWHFWRSHRASSLSGGMLSITTLFYFFAVGRFAFERRYGVDTIEERFGLAAFAVSLIIHVSVMFVESMYIARHLRMRELIEKKEREK